MNNTKIYSSDLSLAVFEILNNNPIFLPKLPQDLNPVEDLWRVITDRIYKTYYSTLGELIAIFKEGFNKFVGLKSYYENWLNDRYKLSQKNYM